MATDRDATFPYAEWEPIPLTPFEAMIVEDERPGSSMSCAAEFHFDGAIQREPFEQAYESAFSRHKLIRAVIRGHGKQQKWCPAEHLPPLYWNHEFADRNGLTLGAGYGQTENFGSQLTQEAFGSLNEVLTESNEALYLTAMYARTIEGMDIKIGAEGFWNNVNPTVFSVVDIPGIGTSIQDFDSAEFDRDEKRIFLDIRRNFGDRVLAQGQIAYLAEYDTAAGLTPEDPDHRNTITYNLGLAYEPVAGHWLRGGRLRTRHSRIPFTLSPINVLGLKGALVPRTEGNLVESRIVRWDAEWSDRVFTSAEYENQSTGFVSYRSPDGQAGQSFDSANIEQFRLSANALLGWNFAAHANYTHVSSRVTADRLRGERVAFVPGDTLNFGLVWTNKRRLSARLTGNYVGNQVDYVAADAIFPGNDPNLPEVVPVDGFFTADAQVKWEPLDKRFELRAGVLNLFGNDSTVTVAVTSPGRTFFASAKARF